MANYIYIIILLLLKTNDSPLLLFSLLLYFFFLNVGLGDHSPFRLLGSGAAIEAFGRTDPPADANEDPIPSRRVDCRRAEGCPGGFLVGRGAYAHCPGGQRHVARGNR